jgi:hypothetical protein
MRSFVIIASLLIGLIVGVATHSITSGVFTAFAVLLPLKIVVGR